MTREQKDTIAVTSAMVMLLFGISLTTAGFVIPPTGEIHESVLWVLGQALIYAGSIFGIAYYARGVVDRRIAEIEDKYKLSKDEPKEEAADDVGD